METPVPDYLREVLTTCAPDNGDLADYIPELATVDPDRLGVALCTLDGTIHAAGDSDARFTIQSISKPFAYALALTDRGMDTIEDHVSVEPSGDGFNKISLGPAGRPRNPMINIGAITTHALVGEPEATSQERSARILAGLSAFAGRDLEIDEEVFRSELKSASRNMALAYMVDANGLLDGEPHEVIEGYTRQCAALVSARDLAVMGMTLANQGINPVTGTQVVPEWVCRQVLSVMSTCGMYDAAGDWMSSVGIPAKSGVSGGVLGALPGQIGIGTFSPRLDRFGNSSRGVRVCERLSEDMGLHLMRAPEMASHVVYAVSDDLEDPATVAPEISASDHLVQLQGTLHFAAAEAAVRELAMIPADGGTIVVDLGRVTALNSIGRRLLREGIRRLRLDGHEVYVNDRNGHLR